MSDPKIPLSVLKPQQILATICTLEDSMTLNELIQIANDHPDWSISDMFLDREVGFYEEHDTWTLQAVRFETPEEIQVRVDEYVRQYNERMAEINEIAEKKRKQREDKEWKEFQRLKKKFNDI